MVALNTAQILVTTLSLFSLSLISSSSGARSSYPYTVVCPSEIRSNSKYQIITTLNNNSYPSVTFQFTVYEGNKKIVSKTSSFTEPTQTASFLKIPILVPSSPPSQYTLSVKVTPAGGSSTEDEKSKHLTVIYTDFTVFIQTDKPIYKPSDVVRYRVLVLDRNFRPFSVQQSVIIIIRDPVGNIIHSVFDAKIPPKRGMLSSKLSLSPEPQLGDWTIKVYVFEKPQISSTPSQYYETQNTKTSDATFTETQVFTVREYVLPKFKLNLQISPSFVTVESPKFIASVEPMYTFGKPVYGKCSFTHERIDIGKKNSSVVVRALNVTAESPSSSSLQFDSESDLGIDLSQVTSERSPQLRITAQCEDSLSGKSYDETIDFKMYRNKYTIDLVHEREYVKRGVNHTLKLRVLSPDRKTRILDASELSVNYLGKNETLRGLANGETSHQIVVPSDIDEESITLSVTYKDYTKTFVLHLSSKISIDYYMKVSLDPEMTLKAPPTEGQFIYLNIFSTFILSNLNLIGLSKGDIIYNNYFILNQQIPPKSDTGPNPYHSVLEVRLPSRIPPTLTLLAYTSDLTQQLVVSDVFKFIVRQTERLGVNLTVSNESVEPGANVTITIKGLANSVFGLRAIDESVLLLKAYPDDLNEKKLFKAGQRFDFKRDNVAAMIGNDNTQRDMTNSGLLLITNIEDGHAREKTKFKKRSEDLQTKSSSPSVQATQVSDFYNGPPQRRPKRERGNNNNGVEGNALQTKFRERFPETWIWEDYHSVEGNISVVKTVPDSITSWTISAFQVNEQRGLGFSEYPGTSLIVFRSFFVSTDLPYSLVQGEVLSLQVNVYNYQPFEILAQITMNNQDKYYEFLDSRNSTSFTKSIPLNAFSVASVIFPISVIKVGIIHMKVIGRCNTAVDAISVPLIVKPIGTRYEKTDSKLILVSSTREFTATLVPTFPPERIIGADLIRVSVVGNILGGIMGNLGNLLTIPSGCGEQNMVRLVPNIVVLNYLAATSTLADRVRMVAYEYLRIGYQQQLNYRRSDSSFSIFGERDSQGSTWLTAYVIRYFIEAKRYISIDDSVIESGLRFLSNNQESDGSFRENGRVLDKSLQGNTAQNSITLTAFVLLAFQAAQTNGFTFLQNSKYTLNIIINGVAYIHSQSTSRQLNPYGNALVAYVLSEYHNSVATKYLDTLKKDAQTNVNLRFKYWTSSGEQLMPYQNPPSSSVETTAYALLALVSNGQMAESLDVVRWLVAQRNSYGGFGSSQDTVVGILALAKYEETVKLQKQTPTKMRVEIYQNRNFGGEPLNTFYIAPNNLTFLQEFFVPHNTQEIHIKATGTGVVLAQLAWSYYVDNKNYYGTDLTLDVLVSYTSISYFPISIILQFSFCSS